jgi:YesN/AraC family two-component response regulator
MIILDAVLENENGLDLVGRFRMVSSARILVLTGYGTETLMLQALRARVDDYVKKPVSLSVLDAALERLLPRPRVSADLAARARQYLEEHSAKPIRLADVAGQLGVSLAHLRWLFRTAYGETPTRYLAGLRMRRASLLLRTTSWGVERIALEAGFPNVT